MEQNMRNTKGFTLIELMIVVAILAILTSIAIPSYQSYVVKGNRAAVQAFMVDIANREKQYLLDARSYALDLATLGMPVPSSVSKHYSACCNITVTASPPSFTITAIPTSAQQLSDGTLTLASGGAKTPAGKW
jgi:type IV pilus assembly protein PilE